MHKVLDYPDCDGPDPIVRMRVYQLALKVRSASAEDAEIVRLNPITEKIAGQLYTAAGSISANIVEGYSRSSGRDRARIFEYALGSARESIEWYQASNHVLTAEVLDDRCPVLHEIVRMLLAIIPRERERIVRPSK
jgi:four helix bundle protein